MNKRNFVKFIFVLLIISIFIPNEAVSVQKVVILWGQSNNAGLGTPGIWPENPNVKIWNNATKQFENLREGFGLIWGLEMSLGEELPGIYIIKVRHSNGSLYVDFRPRQGAYYMQAMSITLDALAELSNPDIVAFLWTQGERDSRFDDWTAEYKSLQHLFIQCVREDLEVPCLPFIMCGVGATNTGTYKNRDEINAIKEYIANRMNIVITFPTTDLPQRDGVHYNNAGLTELGIRYANEVIKFMFLCKY